MINIVWSTLESNYLRYDQDAWKIIGGKVLENHKNIPDQFENSCAIRISRALNKSGAKIPYEALKTISGADKLWYYYRVKDLKHYIENRYGLADIITKDKKQILNKKGIICFDVNIWTDATGHFTLFDGTNALGGSHNSDFYFKNSTKVSLWRVQ